MKPTPLILVASIALTLVALAPTASAHATAYTPDGKIKFVFGNLNEPVYTFVKTGLDLGVFDNRTGAPLGGLVPSEGVGDAKIHVTLMHGDQSTDMTSHLAAQFGKPGWVTFPIIYTEPGLYPIHVTGTINGTAVDQTIQPKHAVPSSSEIMWPKEYDTPDKTAGKIAALQQQMTGMDHGMSSSGSKANAAGVQGLFLLALLGLTLVALRRGRA